MNDYNVNDKIMDEFIELVKLHGKSNLKEMDTLPLHMFNNILNYCLEIKDFRVAFLIVAHTNLGLSSAYARYIKYRDVVDENNNIKNVAVIGEQTVFLNDAVKLSLSLLLQNSEFASFDYLITSTGRYKGYELETYTDINGKEKAVRKNGKYVYKLDENGNKIPKPLSRCQEEKIIKDCIVNYLNTPLRNDYRCSNGELNINTHSFKKLYDESFKNKLSEIYHISSALANIIFDEINQINNDVPLMHNHKKRFYELCREIKKETCMNLNIGLDVLKNYIKQTENPFCTITDTKLLD